MPTLAEFEAQVNRLYVDAALFHAIIHGDAADPDVTTEGGPVPPVAKAIASLGAAPSLRTILGLTTYANIAAANTAEAAMGKVFFNTETNEYEVTNDIT